ncbi:MAG: response regulator transcription factor [Acidobacteria bacterium]|nr:response regulator transcription factor [Acidobacteriota bacterium]
MIRILIADDHAVVRRGLAQILAEAPEITSVGEAQNANEIMSLIRSQTFDLVILDLALPDKNGLEVLKDVKREHPKLPVLVLSMHPEDQYALRVLKAGAAGYLTKESAPEELITVIKKVLKGGRYISSQLAEQLVLDLGAGATKPIHDSLSDREYQIMCLIASGKTISEVADLLAISVKTASTYRTRILEKMQMKTNAELTHYAIQQKLVT